MIYLDLSKNIWNVNVKLKIKSTQPAGLRIYWLYPLQRRKTPQKRGVLSMTLNCIWWWGSSFEDLERVKYRFIAITPRSTLIYSGSTCLGPIYDSNRFLKIIHIHQDHVQKKRKKEKLYKKCENEIFTFFI